MAILWSDQVGMPNPNHQSSKRAPVVVTQFFVKYMGRLEGSLTFFCVSSGRAGPMSYSMSYLGISDSDE